MCFLTSVVNVTLNLWMMVPSYSRLVGNLLHLALQGLFVLPDKLGRALWCIPGFPLQSIFLSLTPRWPPLVPRLARQGSEETEAGRHLRNWRFGSRTWHTSRNITSRKLHVTTSPTRPCPLCPRRVSQKPPPNSQQHSVIQFLRSRWYLWRPSQATKGMFRGSARKNQEYLPHHLCQSRAEPHPWHPSPLAPLLLTRHVPRVASWAPGSLRRLASGIEWSVGSQAEWRHWHQSPDKTPSY